MEPEQSPGLSCLVVAWDRPSCDLCLEDFEDGDAIGFEGPAPNWHLVHYPECFMQ
jgi:hypothetical protein